MGTRQTWLVVNSLSLYDFCLLKSFVNDLITVIFGMPTNVPVYSRCFLCVYADVHSIDVDGSLSETENCVFDCCYKRLMELLV